MGFPWMDQTIAMLAKHPNVFADVAGLSSKPWQAYRSLALAYEYGVISKLLFASDFPNRTVKVAAEAIYNLNKITLGSVLPAIPREQLRGIVERDSLRLLGLVGSGAHGDSATGE
jgi:predicted TIM-barrel fold metal-dependent hydrolase